MQTHDLSRHMLIHSGEKPFKCNECGKTFVREEKLKIHERIHTGEKPYSCEVCGQNFAHSYTLDMHKRLHTGEKPFSCDFCGKTFIRSTHYKEHIRLHTGERPYLCDHDKCKKSFRTSYLLAAHKSTHNKETVIPCEICGKISHTRGTYAYHIRRYHPESKSQAPNPIRNFSRRKQTEPEEEEERQEKEQSSELQVKSEEQEVSKPEVKTEGIEEDCEPVVKTEGEELQVKCEKQEQSDSEDNFGEGIFQIKIKEEPADVDEELE